MVATITSQLWCRIWEKAQPSRNRRRIVSPSRSFAPLSIITASVPSKTT
jgi:hypothetical protein